MLGWVLKKSLEGATGAPGDTINADDTQLEQPDTPAPVFAARAFKHALFGTPAPKAEQPNDSKDATILTKNSNPIDTASKDLMSPSKPPGILLTPGTGTTRRKRVSFGRDVMDNGVKQDDSVVDEKSGFRPRPRPLTKLSEALENSRKGKKSISLTTNLKKTQSEAKDPEDAWEEIDELDRDPDITVDLNEPHSQSGKYWKSEFQKYHEEAKAEMEKLVKYKQLAKSFAKKKDAEALELSQKLKEEQEKVAQMEGKIAELANRMASKRITDGDQDDQEIMDSLARQTALAIQYKDQVKELEALLGDRYHESDEKGRRRRQATSPRTTKTLLETQRELRNAREQVKELGDLRQEVRRLTADLASAEKREFKLDTENKRLATAMSRGPSEAEDLERRLKRAEEEIRRKDNQYNKLKETYDTLKENAKARYAEARDVLQRKNEEISELKKQLRILKAGETEALKEDIKSMSAGQHELDPWAKKLADLQVKLKAEQDARHREREDASITINRLEKESRNVAQPDKRKVLASRKARTWEAASTSSALATRTTYDKVNIDDGDLGFDAGATYKVMSSDSTNARLPDRTRSARVHTERTREGTRKASRVPEVQAALDALRPSSSESDGPKIDLVQGRFKKLGGPDPNSSTVWTMNTSRTTLPADRRAAAIARLEQKKAERRKVQESSLYDKENVQP
ncbi:Urease [Pleurostoma richardsiae]|uniref:Urease n=1 Tax=Pleurostoma richardsiae TaxID=41990 RepID=A0AA38RHY0_9PEZI|nr:Urease [Pleurostoma richardsiae]